MNTEDVPSGFRLPLFRALTEQILMAGAPKNIIILNVALAAIFLISLQFYWIVPLNIVIHFAAIFLSKEDDQLFDCLRCYLRKKNYYCT